MASKNAHAPAAIYLRKSRSDIEMESGSDYDTLDRHRRALLDLAKKREITIGQIYEEIVSGETISARPIMRKLLSDVEAGVWSAVLVMEVERLARGNTTDQGIVADTFKYSDTKIITPMKTYDPRDEFDEEYFEFGLFMSRREYKTINRRLQRGRIASLNEGKYISNKTPYGYIRKKLEGQKGFTLEPHPAQSEILRWIFKSYTEGCPEENGEIIGTAKIVTKLNAMGVPSATGQDWTIAVVRGILTNPVYAGWLRWGNRGTVTKMVDGQIVQSRPRAKANEIILTKGMHEPLITQECFDAAAVRMANNPSRPGPKQVHTTNPLAGLVTCAICGRKMVRRPYQSGRVETLICSYTSCKTVSSDLDVVERTILQSLRGWIDNFDVSEQEYNSSISNLPILETSLQNTRKELQTLRVQEQRTHELVEQRVYSIETFLERSNAIAVKRAALKEKEKNISQEIENKAKENNARNTIRPKIKRVLEAYDEAQSAGEKNQLLKSILEKVIYSKTKSLRWSTEATMSIEVYPRLT